MDPLLQGEVRMFPIHCVKTVVGPFIFGVKSQIPLCHLFASMETQVRRDVACDFGTPYDKSHVLFREELGWPIMIAVVNRCGDRAFCQCVAHAIELLGQRELLPPEHTVHVFVDMHISERSPLERFDRLETATYVCAFCTWSDATLMMRRYLQRAFVVTA
jgi:hypothetical protein